MTLQTLSAVLPWPNFTRTAIPSGFTAAQTLDAAGEYIAYVFQAKEAMTISHVAFRNGTVVASGAGEIRIETVAADGTPSGTLWATNTNVTTGALTSNTTALYALTASASIAKGEFFAVVIKYASGTSFTVMMVINSHVNEHTIPYQVTNVTGSAVKARVAAMPLLALGSSSTIFYALPIPCAAVTAVTAGAFNNTNSAARGLRFQVPFKCRCIGVRNYFAGASGDFNAVLYDDAGAELSSSSTAIDGDYSGGTSAFGNVLFGNPVTLSPGTWYRIAIEPSSATNTNVTTLTLLSADYRSGTPFGSNAHYTTRASGSWDDTATDQLPWMDILIDQLDDGAGAGGGLLAHPGMRGGFV